MKRSCSFSVSTKCASTAEKTETTDSAGTADDKAVQKETAADEVAIEEQVLVDWEGLKITAEEIEQNSSSEAIKLKLLIENDTSKGITMSIVAKELSEYA